MNGVVKIMRLSRLVREYRARRPVSVGPPIRLWIESTSRCNLRCVMCPNKNLPALEKGMMDFGLFKKIVDEARTFAHDLYLHHRGEPLLNPALCDMIAYASRAGLRTRFHTNGTLLDESKAGQLLESGPDLVSFSVDGFDKSAYESVRMGANFEQTVENILRLVRLRRARRLRRPYVVVEKIRFRDPAREGPAEAIRALRARFLSEGVNEVIEKDEYRWTELGNPPIAEPGRVCTFPWYAMVICADGTVTPCPQDFYAKLEMGNVRDAPLLDIWNGPAYQSLRRSFAAGEGIRDLCRRCDRLTRSTVGGVPFQYLTTFLIDQLVGYNRLRPWLGTFERNDVRDREIV